MGLINADGSFTASQYERMHKLGLGQMEFLDLLLSEMNEKFANNIAKRPHEKVTVRSRKTYAIVGHGENWKEQAIKLKGRGISVISTDVCATELIEMGIIPEFIATLEEAEKNVNEHMFRWDLIKKHGIKIVGSIITRQWLEDKCKEEGVHFQRFRGYSQSMVANVGHFGAVVAYAFFADRIILIGMNCYGKENYPWLDWYTQWRRWISTTTDNLIINCTEGGILYFDKVFDIDLDDLEIIEGHPQ
jgi:hypothetical protein